MQVTNKNLGAECDQIFSPMIYRRIILKKSDNLQLISTEKEELLARLYAR